MSDRPGSPAVSDSQHLPATASSLPPAGPAPVECRAWGWRHAGRRAWALNGIDLDIAPGERVLLLGASGSGKSTLLAAMAGLLGGEEDGEAVGSLRVGGLPPEQCRGRVGLVMQDPEAQVVLARVGDDVAFGCENIGIPREETWRRVDDALAAVGLSHPLARSTSALSGGEKQRLALAAVLAMGPGLLLLDEPTANLDPAGVSEVRDAVERVLDRTGATLVVVEHRVDVWADLVDRVIVVLDGRIAADGPLGSVLAERGEELRAAGIWLPGDEDRVVSEAGGGPCAPTAAAPLLSARDLVIGRDAQHPVRSGIDLDIPANVSTCLVGPNGVGKTTLALTLAGLLPALGGVVEVEAGLAPKDRGTDPHDWPSRDLLGRISMVFQEPEYQFLTRTVRAELEVGPRRAGLDGEALDALVDEHLDALGLRALEAAHPMTLSGGEKRRLSVATALISAPRLLVLDEPTFGQDRRAWVELVRLLRRAVDRGTTLVSITHDPAYVRAMGDNVIDLATLGLPGSGEMLHGTEASAVPGHREGDPSTIGAHDARPGNSHTDATPRSQTSTADPTVTPGRTGASADRVAAGPSGADPIPARCRGLMHRVNPVIQFLGLAILTTPLVISIDAVSAGTALLLELLLFPTVGMRVRTALVRALPVLVAAPVSATTMLLYAEPGGEVFWQWGPAVVSQRSVLLALGILVRVIAIGLPAVLLLSRIDPTDMADGLTQVLRLPSRPVIASLAAIRVSGLMMADWRALEWARRIRGVGGDNRLRRFLDGSLALLVFALRRSVKLSLTMEARGFGGSAPRVPARVSRVGWPDAVMLFVCVAIPVLALAAAVWAGTFQPLGR